MKTEVEEERWKNKKNKLWQKEKKGTENRKKKKKTKKMNEDWAERKKAK